MVTAAHPRADCVTTERWLTNQDVDDLARDCLRAAPLAVQGAVVRRGPVERGHGTSGRALASKLLMARLDNARGNHNAMLSAQGDTQSATWTWTPRLPQPEF